MRCRLTKQVKNVKHPRQLLLILLLAIGASACNAANPESEPNQIHRARLKVEGSEGWVATPEATPRLSWKPIEEYPGKAAIGYEGIVCKTKQDAEKGSGSWWTSGLLPVANGPFVYFDASKLPSRAEAWWRVRQVYDNNQRGSWSEIARFETGLKEAADWKAEWIGMDPKLRGNAAAQFRKTFAITKPVSKARLYVCGLGLHESWLNGEKLGNEVLQPAQTDYESRCFYITHDLTSALKSGTNTLGLWVGDGFFNQNKVWGKSGLSYGEPRAIAQLEISYSDGTTELVTTNETWLCKASPVTTNNIYAGEEFDARIADPYWAANNANPEGWVPATKSASPGGKLMAQELPPCREFESVPVKSIDPLKPGTWICDFGQNMVGWAKLTVNATPGTTVTLRFAENHLPSGELGFASGGIEATKVIQTDKYTCKGTGTEIWEPRFVYHGFRFAEVTVSGGKLLDGAPGLKFLEGKVVHTEMPVIGEFECSDPTLNDAFQKAYWTQIGNFVGIPTDCPVRERCGWTGDAHNIVPYNLYQFDSAVSWRKYVNDIGTTAERKPDASGKAKKRDSEELQGLPAMIAPGKRLAGTAKPDWGSALVFIPWDLYRFTGDARPLKDHYAAMRLWTEHLKAISKENLVYEGLGDWCKPYTEGKTRADDRAFYGRITPMLSTACYYRCAAIMADTARLLGKPDDAEYFSKLARAIRESFSKSFYGPAPTMTPDQTINAIAVGWDLVDDPLKIEAAKRLNQQVIDAKYHFMTGVFGMPSLWPTLLKYGYPDTAWKALQAEDSPSLKYLTKRGGTTFWEVWPSEKDEGKEYERSMSHPFQGGFVAWFFGGLAGISPGSPGFKQIKLEPQMMDGLNWVRCRYTSAMGDIESSWKREGAQLVWTVEIPLGANASLRIPGKLVSIAGGSPDLAAKAIPANDPQGVAQRVALPPGKYTVTSDL